MPSRGNAPKVAVLRAATLQRLLNIYFRPSARVNNGTEVTSGPTNMLQGFYRSLTHLGISLAVRIYAFPYQ